ncbi:MAG: hypothetical protein GY711_09690 [bacterium]|nr:hypothetical protein [bacterium]
MPTPIALTAVLVSALAAIAVRQDPTPVVPPTEPEREPIDGALLQICPNHSTTVEFLDAGEPADADGRYAADHDAKQFFILRAWAEGYLTRARTRSARRPAMAGARPRESPSEPTEPCPCDSISESVLTSGLARRSSCRSPEQ